MSTRVLVIEDNAANLDLMTYLLRSLGYEVFSELNGLSGLQTATERPFDLVLADILMPQMDGYEFARRFKAVPHLVDIPLIAVTALAMPGDREKIIASGFDGYLSKPIDPQHFAEQIDGFLSKKSHG